MRNHRRLARAASYYIPLLLLLASTYDASAQGPGPDTSWGRLQSTNGEFSVEFPTSLAVIKNKEGVAGPQAGGGLYWREMRILTSYATGTLLSIEIYKESKGDLDKVFESDSGRIDLKGINRKSDTVITNGVSIRQVAQTTAESYMVRQYLSSSSHIYILTAATRGGETAAMKRFLDSIIFDPKAKAISPSNGVNVDSLSTSPLEILQKSKTGDKSEALNLLSKPTGSELILLAKPRPSYTDDARQRNVQGTIRIKATLGVNGAISKIEVLSPLGGGLVRQAIFAALRAKFLPDEKAGVAKVSEAVLEYSFKIY